MTPTAVESPNAPQTETPKRDFRQEVTGNIRVYTKLVC